MVLKFFEFAAIAAFWGSILWSLHKRGGFWAEWPISSELSGKFDNPVDAAFVLTGIALALFPFAVGYGLRGGWPKPALILGFPVGYVGAEEAKAALVEYGDVPFVTLRGRRGGSALAAAAVNALARPEAL